jgi:hypothetical protein
MTAPVIEQALDEAIAENAKLDRVLEQVGQSYVNAAAKLRRAGLALLELERTHPELATEINRIRCYIWPAEESGESGGFDAAVD